MRAAINTNSVSTSAPSVAHFSALAALPPPPPHQSEASAAAVAALGGAGPGGRTGCGAAPTRPRPMRCSDMPVRRSDYALLHQLDDSPHHIASAYSPGLQLQDKRPQSSTLTLLSTHQDDISYDSNPYAPSSESAALTTNPTPSSVSSPWSDRRSALPDKPFFFCGAAVRNAALHQLDAGAAGDQDILPYSDAGPFKAAPVWMSSAAGAAESVGNGWNAGAFSEPLYRDSSGSSITDSFPSLDSSDVRGDLAPVKCDSTFLDFLYGHAPDKNDADSRPLESQGSWAQQTEQTYSLQLAVALRMVAEAERTEEPSLLAGVRPFSSRKGECVEATAHRLWVNGSLGYNDRVEDGFYHIWGMNPHVWSMCNDSASQMPTLESLRAVDHADASFDVIVVDKNSDSHLRELERKALDKSKGLSDFRLLAEQLGKLVCSLLGGAAPCEDGDLIHRWEESSRALKECVNSVVLPIGSLSVGLCRHRALLFKRLADKVKLPCRIVRGCKYCCLEEGLSCNILGGGGLDREFYVDLVARPGQLCEPDSSLLGCSSSTVASPLRMADSIDSQNERSMSRFNGSRGSSSSDSSSQAVEEGVKRRAARIKQFENYRLSPGCLWPVRSSVAVSSAEDGLIQGGCRLHVDVDSSASPQCSHGVGAGVVHGAGLDGLYRKEHGPDPCGSPPGNFINEGKPSSDQKRDDRKDGQRDPLERVHGVKNNDEHFNTTGSEISLAVVEGKVFHGVADYEISWEDLKMGERVGHGSFGTVLKADWLGSDVAVKILIEQDLGEERLKEFLREVAILKRLRHPNVVLFMGVITQPPHLSIVTEYLPRGSLFKILHRPALRVQLDEKKRIRMALDVSKGMNYLHRSNPPIVHRDLKTPNLLVDKNWNVKVCDFGLSRFKGSTFLSSRSGAGTPEWMAPEVLRDEQSNEKCDVYSFGVVLWELVTLQVPWNGLSPPQVVGAVGFQGRRLQIPNNTAPEIVSLIESCWLSDPKQRPSFANIMQHLKPLERMTVDSSS